MRKRLWRKYQSATRKLREAASTAFSLRRYPWPLPQASGRRPDLVGRVAVTPRKFVEIFGFLVPDARLRDVGQRMLLDGCQPGG